MTIGRSVEERLARCLETLPGDQRRLLEVVWREGVSHQHLAARFELPLGTVKTRIRTGMSRLRVQMAR